MFEPLFDYILMLLSKSLALLGTIIRLSVVIWLLHWIYQHSTSHIKPLFVMVADLLTVGSRCKKWKRAFGYFFTAEGVTKAEQNDVLMLGMPREEVQDVLSYCLLRWIELMSMLRSWLPWIDIFNHEQTYHVSIQCVAVPRYLKTEHGVSSNVWGCEQSL